MAAENNSWFDIILNGFEEIHRAKPHQQWRANRVDYYYNTLPGGFKLFLQIQDEPDEC